MYQPVKLSDLLLGSTGPLNTPKDPTLTNRKGKIDCFKYQGFGEVKHILEVMMYHRFTK